jgi:hypothetical protein
MLAEGAIVNNSCYVTRIVYRSSFGVVEIPGQRQFAKPRLLAPQGRAMSGRGACNLPGFIDVGWPQGQGDYSVVVRNTAPTIRLAQHKATRSNCQDCNDEPRGLHLIHEFCKPSHAVSCAIAASEAYSTPLVADSKTVLSAEPASTMSSAREFSCHSSGISISMPSACNCRR